MRISVSMINETKFQRITHYFILPLNQRTKILKVLVKFYKPRKKFKKRGKV